MLGGNRKWVGMLIGNAARHGGTRGNYGEVKNKIAVRKGRSNEARPVILWCQSGPGKVGKTVWYHLRSFVPSRGIKFATTGDWSAQGNRGRRGKHNGRKKEGGWERGSKREREAGTSLGPADITNYVHSAVSSCYLCQGRFISAAPEFSVAETFRVHRVPRGPGRNSLIALPFPLFFFPLEITAARRSPRPLAPDSNGKLY